MSLARETNLNFFVMYLSPLMSEVYLLFNLFFFFKVICLVYSSVDCFHIW